MKPIVKIGILIMLALPYAKNMSYAGEADMLINKLAEKGIITYGEAQQIMTESNEEARKKLAKGEVGTIPGWIQNISMKSDLRLRHQGDFDSTKSFPRIRERMRLRVGFSTRMIESAEAGFGIATGGETTTTGGGAVYDTEPTSTNHTFANGFAKAQLMVDYAYIKYAPAGWLTVTGGKMKAGTHVWNPTDLLWDGDINPDGVAATAATKVAENTGVFLTGAWLTFNESNTAADDPDAYIIQPGFTWKPTDRISVKGALAFQKLNVNGKLAGPNYGTPAFDYVATNPSLDVKFSEIAGPYALGIFGDSVSNGDSGPSSDKSGGAYGLEFGHAKLDSLGQWQVKYIKRELQQNSWLNKLGDSDAYGGAVNSTGYEIIVNFGLTKATSFGIDYYAMDLINGAVKAPKSLVQFDLVHKF
ncbi:MAG: hypothetical protein A2314_03925 [Elusimicrobia bacterium RIFOXYB2_FULL_50_12]|nr:MAG: hypothetical protein A2314_03925 [Elusimicrobia bacterium RIFOXYB2_FULL_50_12]